MPQEGTCRSCGAKILWVRTAATNALMPLDAEPCADGNIVLRDEKAHVLKGDLFAGAEGGGPRYKSHFACCPNARKHRKKK